MSSFELSGIIYALMLLVLIGSGWWRMRGDTRKELKNALTWVMLVTILMLGWALFH